MEKELTPKQQTSEAIRQAETVLILTGQHPSVDQVASTIALASILRKFGKKVSAAISDDIPAGAKFLPTNLIDRELGGLRDFIVEVGLSNAEVDKLKYTIENGKLNIHISPFSGGFKSSDVGIAYGDYHYDLVIVLGVASYSRIDRLYAQSAGELGQTPLVNIDYHRSNEQYGAINLIEPSAAGLGEILVALSESLQTGLIDTPIATAILTGIYAATDRFTATHTTSKALTVAAQMVSVGADQQQVVRGLYRDGSSKRSASGGQSQPGQSQPKKSEQRTPLTDVQPQAESQPRPQAQPQQQVTRTPEPAPTSTDQTELRVLHTPSVQTEDQQDLSQPNEPAKLPQLQPEPRPQPQREPQAQPQPQTANPQPTAQSTTATANPVESSAATHRNNPPSDSSPIAPSLQELVQAPLSGVDAQQWRPSAPEIEADSPVVTDPDDQATVVPDEPRQARDGSEPEPLINDVDQPRPTQPKPSKPTNPTNNPVFANRLS